MASAWEIDDVPTYPSITEDMETEVVVIGGGLAGLWTAYFLTQAGKNVILLEADHVGRGATLYTTAFITQDIDTDLSDLVSIFGEEKAKLVWQSGNDAVKGIDDIVKREHIDCEFVRLPLCVYAHNEDSYALLEEEHRLATDFGFKTTLLQYANLPMQNSGTLEVEDQAKYHPMKFMKGLLEAATKGGAKIFEGSEVVEIEGEDTKEIITKSGRRIRANDVIIATYEPLTNKETHLKKGMYLSYVFELEIPKGSFKEGMYLDTRNPYHYFRIDVLEGSHDRMIVGGEDHRAELGFLEDKSFKALEEFVKETFPRLDYTIIRKWRGGILEPSDGLPLIGKIGAHEYVATAFSGNGMTFSYIAGRLLCDLVTGQSSAYKDLYDPKRTLTGKALVEKGTDYIQEFFGGAVKNLFK